MDDFSDLSVNSAQKANTQIVLFTMCLGVLIAQLDTSVVNLAIRHIGQDLGVGIRKLQWVVDAYNLVYASLLLTGGTLGDLFGRRRVFAVGISIFTIGSLVCGLAPDAIILIAGRAITGLGAALLLPTSLSILAVSYPDPKERGRAIGVWASCNGLAFALGPTLGGWIVDVWGWRAIFLMIVPVSAFALVLAVRRVPESAHPEGRRLDLVGQSLAILFLAALTLGAIEGAHWGWGSVATLVCATVCVAALALFILIEARTEGALVPIALFFRKGLSASISVAALMTFGMYALLFLTPLYLQEMRGATTLIAGVELLPMSLTFLVVSRRSGPLVARYGSRAVMTSGMALMAWAC